MRTAAAFLAVTLCILAAPALIRSDSARRAGHWFRAGREALRGGLAFLAGSALIVALWRTR